jgi:competence protein ComEC
VSVETPIMILDADDRFSCGNFDFTVLSADTLSNEENNNSLVLLGEIGGENWLFTGDAEEMVESAILSRIDQPIAGLKIGHHGSLTSSSAAFLDQCQPLFATISVGNPNAFGHPDQAILDRFEERKINLYRTDQDGMMTFQYLPWFDIVVMTSRNQADFRAFFWNRIRSIRQINGTAFSIS